MEITPIYILSQIFIILNYVFLVITYQLKKKEKILLFNIAAQTSAGLSYICLGAYTGLAMTIVSIIRNIVFIVNEKKNGVSEKTTPNEILMLLVIFALIATLSVITFNGFLSLMSVFATMLYTFSVWQKNTKIYKILGIPVSILWISYNIYIGSIFGIILEIILMISAIIGFVKEVKTKCN